MSTNRFKLSLHFLFVFILQCSHTDRHEASKLQTDTSSQQIQKPSIVTVPPESVNISHQYPSFDSIQIGPDLKDFIPISGNFKKLNGPAGVGEIDFDISDSMLFAKSQGAFYQFNDSSGIWFSISSDLPNNVFKGKDIFLGNYQFRLVDVNDRHSCSGHRRSIMRRHANKTNWTKADSALVSETNHCSVNALAGFKGNLFASLAMADDFGGSTCCGIFRSPDYGMNWSAVPMEFPEMGCVESFFSTEDVLFVIITTRQYNVFNIYSTSDGISWKRPAGDKLINSELPSRIISTMAKIGKTCFIFGLDVGGGTHLFISNDNGRHWKASDTIFKPVFRNLHSLGSRLIGYNFIDNIILDGIFISSDSGTTWQAINDGLPTEKYFSNSIAICNGNILFLSRYLAGHLVYKLFISKNYGAAWSETPLYDRKDSPIDYIQQVNNSLFVGGREGLFRSNDCGTNWSHTFVLQNLTKIVAIDKRLFTGTYHGLYASSDNGITWVQLGKINADKRNLEQGLIELVSMDSVLFAHYFGFSNDSCNDININVSRNKGAFWSSLKSCLPNYISLYSLGPFLLASSDTALYSYSDSTRKWSLVNSGFLKKGINCIAQYNQNYFIATDTELFITNMVSDWNKINLPWDRSVHIFSMSADSGNVIISTKFDLWQLTYSIP